MSISWDSSPIRYSAEQHISAQLSDTYPVDHASWICKARFCSHIAPLHLWYTPLLLSWLTKSLPSSSASVSSVSSRSCDTIIVCLLLLTSIILTFALYRRLLTSLQLDKSHLYSHTRNTHGNIWICCIQRWWPLLHHSSSILVTGSGFFSQRQFLSNHTSQVKTSRSHGRQLSTFCSMDEIGLVTASCSNWNLLTWEWLR